MGREVPIIRIHRRKSGLSQREVARLIGYQHPGEVSRQESGTLPSLHVALSYQVLFGIPIERLFPEAHRRLKDEIEARLANFEDELHQQTPKGREMALVAHKLEWIWKRRNSPPSELE